MKSFIKEFKDFINKGNVLDMAVGVVIGGAFGKISASLVANIITPLLAMLVGSPNTDALNFTLRAATEDSEAIVLGLGTFIGTIIDFVIIAFAIFLVLKAVNKAKAVAEAAKKKEEEEAAAAEPEPEPEPEPSKEELLLTEIRDLLKAQKK
ncbi:MAG: large-conductance mechanosensitive channel protein MscL [bacterium]